MTWFNDMAAAPFVDGRDDPFRWLWLERRRSSSIKRMRGFDEDLIRLLPACGTEVERVSFRRVSRLPRAVEIYGVMGSILSAVDLFYL